MGLKVRGGRAQGVSAPDRIDLFTKDEVLRAKKESIRTVMNELIPSIMPRIDAETGQTNDARYMAYRLMYIASHYNG